MLKIELNGECMARQGSMVAFQGQVHFEGKGAGGIGKFLKQQLTGEGVPLMKRADQLGLGTLLGRTTGEAVTLSFAGRGFVIVQPSEEPPPQSVVGGHGGGQESGTGGVLGGLFR